MCPKPGLPWFMWTGAARLASVVTSTSRSAALRHASRLVCGSLGAQPRDTAQWQVWDTGHWD